MYPLDYAHARPVRDCKKHDRRQWRPCVIIPHGILNRFFFYCFQMIGFETTMWWQLLLYRFYCYGWKKRRCLRRENVPFEKPQRLRKLFRWVFQPYITLSTVYGSWSLSVLRYIIIMLCRYFCFLEFISTKSVVKSKRSLRWFLFLFPKGLMNIWYFKLCSDYSILLNMSKNMSNYLYHDKPYYNNHVLFSQSCKNVMYLQTPRPTVR